MMIKGIRVKNYKSFHNSGWTEFDDNINFITGKNNCGKSSMLSALSGMPKYIPHKSVESTANSEHEVRIEYTVILNKAELEDAIGIDEEVVISAPEIWRLDYLAEKRTTINLANELYNRLIESEWMEVSFELEMPESGNISCNQCENRKYVNRIDESGSFFSIIINKNPRGGVWPSHSDMYLQSNIHEVAYRIMLKHIYLFSAFRNVSGYGPFSKAVELDNECSNLPQCLLSLQANPSRFQRLVRMMSEVFDDILYITLHTETSGVQIRIWSHEIDTEREDLSVPLEDSGTGFGQALAILYVLLTSENKILLIDEPASFLHPGAARSLFNIIKRFAHSNQFIISTHSPESISIIRPERILLLRRNFLTTEARVLLGRDLVSIQSILAEVGARLSDIFSTDSIMWVEGPTEELCFPLILRHKIGHRHEDFLIKALHNTGDVTSKKSTASVIWQIYQKLSSPSHLMPVVLSFSLDQEGRSTKQIRELEKISRGLVSFLPRKTYENYLIHPSAIAHLINGWNLQNGQVISELDVVNWIKENSNEKVLFRPQTVSAAFSENWKSDINAPKLLEKLLAIFRKQSMNI